MPRTATCLVFILVTTAWASELFAAVDLCVATNAEGPDAKGFEKLVLSEIGRHPSHRVVSEGCAARFVAELFAVDGKRFLTARIDREVPVRYEIADDKELEPRIAEAVSLVLGNDPVYLAEDVSRLDVASRAAHTILKRGTNIWRVELFETLARGGGSLAFAPGGAVAVTRGADHLQVLARVYFAGWPGSLEGYDPALRIDTGADVGLTYEVSDRALASFYVSAGAGIEYLRYEGRVAVEEGASVEHIDEIGAALFARMGVRFLRFTDFDCDLFAAGYLPLFNTENPDSLLFAKDGLYTPSIQIGMGVGF